MTVPAADVGHAGASLQLLDDAVERGATLLAGGKALEGTGTFYEPTVLTDVVAGSAILREEIFGPVLAIATFVGRRAGADTRSGMA